MSNNEQFLTHENPSIRDFAKERLKEGDLNEWSFYEFLRGLEKAQKPKTYIFELRLKAGLARVGEPSGVGKLLERISTLYCEILYCQNTKLKELPNLPICKELQCSANYLRYLPSLPKCEVLNCVDNRLEKLPDLPKCEELYCGNNLLKKLPQLTNCKILHCGRNELEELPNLPKCEELECHLNNLKELPDLSKCLELICDNNNLTELPPLSRNCKFIHCDDNVKYSHNFEKAVSLGKETLANIPKEIDLRGAVLNRRRINKTIPWNWQRSFGPHERRS